MLLSLIEQNFSLVQLQSLYIQAYLCISLYIKYKKNIQIKQFIPLIYFIFCFSCSLNMVLEPHSCNLQHVLSIIMHSCSLLFNSVIHEQACSQRWTSRGHKGLRAPVAQKLFFIRFILFFLIIEPLSFKTFSSH